MDSIRVRPWQAWVWAGTCPSGFKVLSKLNPESSPELYVGANAACAVYTTGPVQVLMQQRHTPAQGRGSLKPYGPMNVRPIQVPA